MWKRDASPKPVGLPPEHQTPVQAPTLAVPALRQPDPPMAQMVVNVGKSMIIKGELSASEDMTLCGQMEGRVAVLDHTLTIGPDADIRADITAGTVVVMGAVVGNVTASRRVDVRATGSVTGDVASPGLAIEDGGQLIGKVQMTGSNSRVRRTA
jgi:cytoskeletal protein CcmA (bactofilin family)